jgi:hypothetical protein
MPAPSCDEWLAFTRGRRQVRIANVSREAGEMRLWLSAELPVEGLTVQVGDASRVEVDGEASDITDSPAGPALCMSLAAGEDVAISVRNA